LWRGSKASTLRREAGGTTTLPIWPVGSSRDSRCVSHSGAHCVNPSTRRPARLAFHDCVVEPHMWARDHSRLIERSGSTAGFLATLTFALALPPNTSAGTFAPHLFTPP